MIVVPENRGKVLRAFGSEVTIYLGGEQTGGKCDEGAIGLNQTVKARSWSSPFLV